jgi:hypothetical protein
MRGCIFLFCHPKDDVSNSKSTGATSSQLLSSSSIFIATEQSLSSSSSPYTDADLGRRPQKIRTDNQIVANNQERRPSEAYREGNGKSEYQSPLEVTEENCWKRINWTHPATILEDILTMGACMSSGGGGKSSNLIDSVDGGEQEYHSRFVEDRILGEGQFGVVTLVLDTRAGPSGHDRGDITDTTTAMACKTLRKGVVFKDNTIFAPIKADILQCEVNILRKLNGKRHCCKLEAVYETPRIIFLVTEFCAGGKCSGCAQS